MLHEYSNLFLPICSVIISAFLLFIYFSKESVKNNDTNYYSKLLIITIIESVYTFCLTASVHLFLNDNTTLIFEYVNKILYMIYITWISHLFLYFTSISLKNKNDLLKKINKVTISVDIIIDLFILFTRVDLIYDIPNKISNSYGPSSNVLYVGCALFVGLMIITTTITYSKSDDKKKFTPMWLLIILMILTLLIRFIDPFVNITSNVVSFISLVMFFYIENPDLKMLRQLQLSKNQMEKSNKIKSDFLSSMSHEIRTPLNAIVGYSQLIEYAQTLEEAKENAQDIIDSSNNLLNMYSNLLDTYKIESGNIEINSKEYNPKEEISNLVKLFEYRVKQKKFLLEENMEEMPILIGPIDIIKKVLINIIDNSIKYTENGSIKISASYINSFLNIQIEDTGIGIKEENMNKLFLNFERLDFKDSNVNGMGLGLALSKNLLESIDGEIKIESKYKVGTKVIITVKQEVKNESISC